MSGDATGRGAASRRSWSKRLFAPVDASSLVAFRVAFGLILVWEVWRYFNYGWIARYFVDPEIHFTYFGFGWVAPWPGDGMYWHMGALGVLAGAIAVGLFYRAAAILFAAGFTYVFLLDQARYLNHFYLISLLSVLLVFISPHRMFSLDALRRRESRSDTVPAWQLWLLRGQIGIVYVFGGLAKINPDWLAGEPMRTWLARRTDFPVLGPFFLDETMVFIFVYGGLLIDLLVVPALLWRRTRAEAFLAVLLFHMINEWLFHIGIFPWLMIAATTLFFEPDWPRRVARFLRRRAPAPSAPLPEYPASRAVGWALVVYFAVQVLVPLRHHLYDGNVAWNEEGHRFSWRMMLREKRVRGDFEVIDVATGARQVIDPYQNLAEHQARIAMRRPDMILQYAKEVARRRAQAGEGDALIHARLEASLNGRPFQPFTDPDADLARVPRDLRHARWILQMREMLIVGDEEARANPIAVE